jgi:hypothetical protein
MYLALPTRPGASERTALPGQRPVRTRLPLISRVPSSPADRLFDAGERTEQLPHRRPRVPTDQVVLVEWLKASPAQLTPLSP